MPAPVKLYPFQREGMLWLAPQRTAALFDPPGLGKTPQALCALQRGVPVVVVCPGAIKGKWAEEVRRWRKSFHVRIVKGTKGKHAFRWPEPGTVTIVNYEVLPPAARELERLRARVVRLGQRVTNGPRVAKMAVRLKRLEEARAGLRQPYPGTVLICDEAHRAKNPEAQCTLRLREMAAWVYQRSGRIWLLTATPLENGPDELWTVLQAAGLGTRAFDDYGSFMVAMESGDVGARLQTVSLRRRREEVLPQLPPKTVETVQVPIGAELRKELDEITKKLRARGINLATATLEQIRTAVNTAGLATHVSSTREALAVAKLPSVLELVADLEHAHVPIVALCCHKRPLELLSRRKGWLKITGDETHAQKHANAADFQAGKLRGIAVGYRAGGVGIDLFHAWRCLEIDLPWTTSALEQGEGRLDRIGQTAAGLLFTRFVADHPLERRVAVLLERKGKLIAKSIDASEVPGSPAT